MFNFSEIGSEKQEKNFEKKNSIYPALGVNANYLTSNSIIASNQQNGNGGINGNEFHEPKNMQNMYFLNPDNFAAQFLLDMKENNNNNTNNNYMNLAGAKFPSISKSYAIRQ